MNGSPVSIVIANLIMEDVEKRALSTFHSPSKFWKRYVDDTFVIIHKNSVEDFLDYLNTIENSIKFTIEKEADHTLPFLDTLVRRNQHGKFSTSVYRICTVCKKVFNTTNKLPNGSLAALLVLYWLLNTEVGSRTQGSRPRPRTQKKSEAKAKDSLSEDRHSRGQGQECSRPRTKDTSASALQKKKVFTKIFQAISKKKKVFTKFF